MSAVLVDRVSDRPAVSASNGARREHAATPALVALVLLGTVLRAWRVGFNGLSYDESFTALAGRLRVGSLFGFLREHDTHPPLDYLLRSPLARLGSGAVGLRLPSLVFSVGALALFAWGARRHGRAGVVATGLLAVSEFQVFHGGEARMYALLQLLGVAALVLGDAWTRNPRRWHAWALAGLLVLAYFDHVSAFLLAGGAFALAGVRGDGHAWRWRAAVVGATVVWALAWGPSFLAQAGHDWVGWIPPTSVVSAVHAIGGQVTGIAAVMWVVSAATLAGGVVLWRRDRRLAWLWTCLGAVPFVVAALVGVLSPFLIDRTLSLAAWAPPVALGVLADVAITRWRRAGTAMVIGVLVVVLAGTASFLATKRYDADLSVDHLAAVARPGDVVATRPARYGALVDYRIGVLGPAPGRTVALPGVRDADARRLGHVAPTGRVWLLTLTTDGHPYRVYDRCAPDWTDGITKVLCLHER